ncbi:hypothetical protein P3S67_012597 [Capsicum chacoense]
MDELKDVIFSMSAHSAPEPDGFSGDLPSLNLIMSKLDTYEKISGKMINTRKSGFIVSSNFPVDCITDVQNITGFSQLQFPLHYLGCPIYKGKNKIVYYHNMIAKVSNKLQGWQGKLLSFRGKATLIKAFLYSLPLYLFSVSYPLQDCSIPIEKIIANFF